MCDWHGAQRRNNQCRKDQIHPHQLYRQRNGHGKECIEHGLALARDPERNQ